MKKLKSIFKSSIRQIGLQGKYQFTNEERLIMFRHHLKMYYSNGLSA